MDLYQSTINELDKLGLTRSLKAVEPLSDGYCNYQGRRLLNLSSNDYLGLLSDETLKADFLIHLAQTPSSFHFGAGSSRLLTGNNTVYDQTEELLKLQYSAQSALLFNSGYHANLGILPALTDKSDLILSDKLCHASIIDGIRLSTADHIRYRHLDYVQLRDILQKKRHLYQHVFIVTESVFSMDGDQADVRELVAIKNEFSAFLYVDEAHSVGVRGIKGLGTCEEHGVLADVEIIVGTFGKALASVGAFAVFSATLKQMMVNKARTLLFTTALPPINVAWTQFVLQRIPALTDAREQLKMLGQMMSSTLTQEGFPTQASHIMPVVVGSNHAAVELSNYLQQQGFLVFAIRPPTVPENTARIRFSLTANLRAEQLIEVVKAVSYYIKPTNDTV